MSSFGLTPQGFVPKQQQQIISEANATLKSTFGSAINLGAETVFGQLVGIFSEREALLWQAMQGIYASWTPGGAEGIAVDNILALAGLQRLPATASVTNPTPVTQSNGVTLYGLVLYGTAGTIIPAGSLIKSSTTPQQTYKLDSQVTIAAASNAAQTLVYSNAPTSGGYTLTLVAPSGSSLTSPVIAYNTQANNSQLTWATSPGSGTFYLMMGGSAAGPFNYNDTALTLQTTLRALGSAFSLTTVSGTVGTTLSINWGTGVYAHNISTNNTLISWSSTPASGTYALTLGGTVNTTALPYNATAATIQAALVAAGYPRARVATVPGGNAINWIGTAVPAVTVTSNTTGASATVSNTYALNQPVNTINSMQAIIDNLYDGAAMQRPFTDVLVTGTGTVFSIAFGAIAPQAGQPATAALSIPTLAIASNTMAQSGNVTNVAAASTSVGAPAQAIGSATNVSTGPYALTAGQLSVIGTPVSGWGSVVNQLDVLPGSNVESDTDAIYRRSALVASQANGPLASIVQKVQQLSGVTQVIGFQNVTDAAIQTISFASMPTSGTYQLLLANGPTAAIAYNATAAGVQSAINAVAGYTVVQVTGSPAFGFAVDFNGAYGSQAEPLLIVVNNTTGVGITAAFGRPPKSVEIVVQGGSSQQVAQAIYGALPAGIQSYGTPAANTTGTTTAGLTSMSVAASAGILVGQAIFGLGVAAGATVASISGTTVTMSAPAIGSYSSAAMTFSNTVQLYDAANNPVLVSFSRPMPVLFYVTVALTTDQYRTPGVPGSGANPLSKFSPANIAQIQSDLVAIGNATPIGGLVVGYGTGGLIGAFNEVPGIVGYTLSFGPTPSPSSNANVQLLPTQAASFQQFNVSVSYT